MPSEYYWQLGAAISQSRSATRTYATAFLLGITALIILTFRVAIPPTPVYDETLYVDAAKAFLAGAPDTNPEVPPMGKYLIAGGIRLFGNNPYGRRAVSTYFGAAIVVAVFCWLYLLLRDYGLALTGAVLALLNNFVYVMSRVAMMDVFLVGFILWALVAFTAVLQVEDLSPVARRFLLGFSGAMLGLATACKWNGIDTLAVVALITAGLLWSARRAPNADYIRYARALRDVGTGSCVVCLIAVPVLVYCLAFWPLCRTVGTPFTVRQVVAMNVMIWKLHRADLGNICIASKWYSWIFQIAPQRALSYLVGNWVIMWGGVAALIFCLKRIWKLPEAFVVSLYAVNLLQWAITPQKHLYYYYYFPCAMFLGAAIPIALHSLPRRVLGINLSLICVAAAAVAFLFCFQRMGHFDPPFDCALRCWP